MFYFLDLDFEGTVDVIITIPDSNKTVGKTAYTYYRSEFQEAYRVLIEDMDEEQPSGEQCANHQGTEENSATYSSFIGRNYCAFCYKYIVFLKQKSTF